MPHPLPNYLEKIDPYKSLKREFPLAKILVLTHQEFASKAGWTSDSRSEVAYINDGQVAYILAVFTQDAAYAQNWQIFPKISELVYQKMQQIHSKYNTP